MPRAGSPGRLAIPQRQLEQPTGDREDEADVDPEDLGDGAGHQHRLADRAPHGKEPGTSRARDRSEQRNATEPEQHLGDLVRNRTPFDRECAETVSPIRARLSRADGLSSQRTSSRMQSTPTANRTTATIMVAR